MPKINEKLSDEPIKKSPKRKISDGWADVASKKKENDEREDKPRVNKLIISDGETVTVQFLSNSPFCFNAHQVKNKYGKWEVVACQLDSQKHCLMCDAGIKVVWKAAFKVLDYRGQWDKDKKKYKSGSDPVEKIWFVSNSLALQIRAMMEKIKTGELVDAVFEVTRTGAGKNDTSYNIAFAFDEVTDKRLKPKEYTEAYPPLAELCTPPTDGELVARGFESSDDDS